MELKDEYLLKSDKINFIMKEDRRPYSSNRDFKDGVFRLLFSEKETALELFNALEGTAYTAREQMELVTLQDAIYNRMFNDLAFQYGRYILSLVEHQSTWSDNMPLRELLYLGRVYEKILDNQEIYKTGIFKIPAPHLHVLYNGTQDRPLETVQFLSSAFMIKAAKPAVELAVKVININFEKQHPILERSQNLKGYALFTSRVRDNMRYDAMDRDEAINDAIRSCIEDGILEVFLRKHGSEVFNMLFTEVTDEDIMNIRIEEAVEMAVAESTEKTTERIIAAMLRKNKSIEEIHDLTEVPIEQIVKIRNTTQA